LLLFLVLDFVSPDFEDEDEEDDKESVFTLY